MKRFVLSCCILAATSTMVFAQATKKATPANTKATTKASVTTKATPKNSAALDFTYKVNEFEAGITRGNDKIANDRFEELKHIMTTDLGSMKPKIVSASSDAEKAKWSNLLSKKQAIYSEIINASSDMKGNKQIIIRKYREYQTTL